LILYVTPRDPILVQRTTSSYTNGIGDCDNVAPGVRSVLDIEGSMNLSTEFAVPLYLK